MMKRRVLIFCFVMSAVCGVLETQAQRRVPCADVVHEIDSVGNRKDRHQPDSQRIASHLGVAPSWVEHCAQLYGRRLTKKRSLAADEERDDREERWESEEPIEAGREEAEQGEFEPQEKRHEPRSTPTPTFQQDMHPWDTER